MQFENRRSVRHIPNLTPLIDIVFLLLVFFMLTSHFVREQAIPIDLPGTDSGEEMVNDGPLELSLDKMGHVYAGEEMIPPHQLEPYLREALGKRQDKYIRLRGDRIATLGNAIELLDTARKAGAEGIEIVTEENESLAR